MTGSGTLVGVCSHCGREVRLAVVKDRLCNTCWKFLHGKTKSWLGVCRECGAQPVRFTGTERVCQRCVDTHIDMDDPLVRQMIKEMRRK